jgi:ferritin-like metal-binding protein YciE
MENKDLDGLFLHTLKDVYFAENAIVKALPKMAKAANSDTLRDAFSNHLQQSKTHVERLEQVFQLINQKAEAVPCEAMKGLLEEGDEVGAAFKGGAALDQGLIASAQTVEHYEIARYGALCAWAKELGYDEAADLLEETLTEEKETDELLSEIAESSMQAAKAA